MIEQLRNLVHAVVRRIRRAGDPQAPFDSINLALEAGDYDTVLRETDRIISRNSSITRILRRRVSQAMKFNSAEEYNNFIRRNPAQAFVRWEFPEASEAHYHRSLVYQRSGRLKSSRTELESSLSEFPDSSKYLTEMGLTLAAMSYRDEAVRYFERAVECDLTESREYSHKALLGLGQCLLEAGRTTAAREAFLRALELDYDKREVHSLLHLTMELESDPRQRAEFLLGKANYEAAREAFEEALNLNPVDFEMLMGVAYNFKEMQQYDKAEEFIRRAFRSNPGSSQVNFALAWVYLMQDRIDDSEAEFVKAIRKNPYDPGYLIGLAYAHLERIKSTDAEDDERLLQLVRRAQELDPSYPEPLIVIAEYNLILNRLDKAAEAIDTAIRLNPAHQPAHIVAAEVFFEKGEHQRAQHHLGEAEEYGRDTEEMRLLRERLRGESY